MRGVVTLAAVFVLPEDTPEREVLVLIAMVVTAGTLVLQGLTLPWLARRLGVHGPDPREDALQEATVLQTAVQRRHCARSTSCADDDPTTQTIDTLRRRAEQRVNIVWERLGSADATQRDTERGVPPAAAADAGRRAAEVLRIRDAGDGRPRGARAGAGALDVEESMLDRVERGDEAARRGRAAAAGARGGACEHLRRGARRTSGR